MGAPQSSSRARAAAADAPGAAWGAGAAAADPRVAAHAPVPVAPPLARALPVPAAAPRAAAASLALAAACVHEGPYRDFSSLFLRCALPVGSGSAGVFDGHDDDDVFLAQLALWICLVLLAAEKDRLGLRPSYSLLRCN